jgi:hypothetical protein
VWVDAQLVRWLRPHQREGVRFLFDCVAGLRLEDKQGERSAHAALPGGACATWIL